MARDYYINGETLVMVKGAAGTSIASLSQLGLADAPVHLRFHDYHMDIDVDAWGGDQGAKPEIQYLLGEATISMTLVHFDSVVLAECLRLSKGGGTAVGTMPHAGQRMGGGVARFVAGNRYIGLNLTSPAVGIPWRFYFAYITNGPSDWPLGVRRSVVTLNWRAIPYTVDPWNGGLGALGQVFWDNTLDT